MNHEGDAIYPVCGKVWKLLLTRPCLQPNHTFEAQRCVLPANHMGPHEFIPVGSIYTDEASNFNVSHVLSSDDVQKVKDFVFPETKDEAMKRDPPKLFALPPMTVAPDKFAQMLREFRANAKNHIEFFKIDAKIKRAKYLALIAEGFTEAQALELCKPTL